MPDLPNPWSVPTLTEQHYVQLAAQHRLSSVDTPLRASPNFQTHGLLVGHHDFERWLAVAQEGRDVALVSGFMTSGFLHLGSLTVLTQMAYYQRHYGARLFIPIADLEAACVRGTAAPDRRKLVSDFLRHFWAAGIDVENSQIYLQSRNLTVLQYALLFTGMVDLPDMERLYDRRLTLGEAFTSLVMAADICLPSAQGCEATLITLGLDEISHLVLTKALLGMLEQQPPRTTYHRLLTGLNGSKMGKSLPENSIMLLDTADSVAGKLRSLSCMRVPARQHPAFNILEWFAPDGIDLQRMYDDWPNTSDDTIELAVDVTTDLLENHRARYEEFDPTEMAEQLIGGLEYV